MSHPLTLGAILVMAVCAALLVWWVTDANMQVRRDLREQRDAAQSDADNSSPAEHEQAVMEEEDDLIPD